MQLKVILILNCIVVAPGQITRDIVGEEVLLGVDLEVGVGGHGVVDPPEPACYKIGKEYINTVVTTGNNESTDTNQTEKERDPVEEEESLGRI